jgi:hypothetical protein
MNFTLACFGVVLGAACTPSVSIDLPLSQVFRVAQTGTVETAQAVVSYRAGSAGCGAVEALPSGDCIVADGVTSLQQALEITLVPDAGLRPAGADMLIEVVARNDRTRGIMLTPVGMFDEIDAPLDAAGPGIVPQVRFVIGNDTGVDQGLQFEGAFVGGVPFMADAGLHVPAGDRLDVQLSDVASAVLANGNGHMFLQIFPYP